MICTAGTAGSYACGNRARPAMATVDEAGIPRLKSWEVQREVKYEVAYVKTVDGCSYIVDELDGDEPVGRVIARLNEVFGIDKPVETPLLDAEKQREQEMSSLIDKYERDKEEFRASGWGTARRVFNRTLAALLILEDLLGN